MGCKGLLQAIHPIFTRLHVSQIANKRCAIDGYAWLHKASFTALNEISRGNVSDKPTKYCLKLIKLLVDSGITPIMVFDGAPLPSKEATNIARHEQRKKAKETADKFREQGDHAQAYKMLGQSISITFPMVEHLLKSLKRNGIEFIVAPYEADAQLGYLSASGYVDFIISEDSDLLLYGCRNIFFKMDELGYGAYVCRSDLKSANLLPCTLFSDDALIQLCVMSGCDYSAGIKGIGLKKGAKALTAVVARELGVDSSPRTRFRSVLRELKQPEDCVPELYEAFLTFKYQVVFDPIGKQSTRVNTNENIDLDKMLFLGMPMSNDLVFKLASGLVDPKKFEPTGLGEITPPRNLSVHVPQKLESFFSTSKPSGGPDKSVVTRRPMGGKGYLGKKRARVCMADENSVPVPPPLVLPSFRGIQSLARASPSQFNFSDPTPEVNTPQRKRKNLQDMLNEAMYNS